MATKTDHATPERLDLRIERTYRSLCTAFTELLAERAYEDVTVSDLCERAMIRRTTFYKHFADKQEFLAFYVRHIREEFQRHGAPLDGHEKLEHHVARMIHELMVFLRENEHLVRSCLTGEAFETVAATLTREASQAMTELVEDIAADRGRASTHARTLADFAAGGLLSTLLAWWEGRMDDVSPEQIEHDLCVLVCRLVTE